MKKILFICLAGMAFFASCKKDNLPDTDPAEVLPEVSTPHSVIQLFNNAQDNNAIIERIYTGTNPDEGGLFPIRSGMSTKLISTNLGSNRFLVMIKKDGVDKSISIFDSNGTEHSKNITGEGHEIMIFENVVVKENQPVSLQYNFSTVKLPGTGND